MTAPPAAGVAIGVDVGGTNVRAARVSRTGSATDHVRLRTDTTQEVARLITEVCHGLLDEDVEAIGVGVPGRISRDGETVLSAGFVKLADIPLAPMLREATGRPVFIENDAHMALLAELE